MNRLATLALSSLLASHLAPPALARQEVQPPRVRAQPGERWNAAPATRPDFVAALIRVGRALAGVPPLSGERREAVNRAIDRAVSFYLSGQAADALRTLDETLLSLLPPEHAADLDLRIARSLKITVDPPVYVPGAGRPSATLASLYPVDLQGQGPPGGPSIRLILTIRRHDSTPSPGASPAPSTPIDVPLGPSPVRVHIADVPLPAAGLGPGAYDLTLTTPRSDEVVAGTAAIAPHSLGAVRIANSDRVARMVVETPELQHALSHCRARNALLTDRPSPESAASLVDDLPGLESAVEGEIRELQALRNPYRRRTGLHWRPVTVGAADTPARLYAPASAAGDAPIPLVIALHGAGGDPDSFPLAYGAGLATRLADQRGFILVSPQVTPAAGAPEFFDAIVESVSFDYAIDPARVYLLAHSVSDRVFAEWADLRKDKIAAACLIAGLPTPGRALPPTLLVAGALDPLVSPEQAESDASAARDAGLPVEFRRIDGQGHLLVVGAVLPDAIDWLMRHRLR